ncbi:transposase family protein [Fulvivirga marina]|nr:transposase family protein [Fulvivirga marina]
MVVRKDIVWLSARELLELVAPDYRTQLEETINKGKYRNKNNGLDSWQHEKVSGDVLINYNTIPTPTLDKYDLPEPAQLFKRNIEQLISIPAKAYDYFLGKPEVYEIARELSETAGWLLFLSSVSRSQSTSMGYNSLDDLYNDAIELMGAKDDWSKWKCNSIQVLKRKLKPFNKLFKKPLNGNYTDQDLYESLDSLISKKYGNSNSQKLGEEQEALLIQIYSEPNKPSIEQTYNMYMRKANEMVQAYVVSNGQYGWSHKALVSDSTVKHFLMSKDVQQLVYEQRHGRQQYRDKFEIVTKRKTPSYANALWVLDGSPVHRYYFDPKTKKAYSRLNAFVILDAHSWCVIGFHVSTTETTEAVKESLRMACELSGYLPNQLQFDNSSAIKSYHAQQCMHALTAHCTPTAVGNARSKIIESFFSKFNDQILKFRTGYTGGNITAKTLDRSGNREALAKQVKDGLLPTIDQAIKELHEDFTLWNHKSFNGSKSPLEKYKESIATTQNQQRPYTHKHEIEAFYEMPGDLKQVKVVDQGKTRQLNQFVPQPYQYTNVGMKLQIDNQRHELIISDPEFNSLHIGESFNIKYDPRNIEKVYLYRDGRPYLFNDSHVFASTKQEFSMALADRTEGETKLLNDHLNSKKKQKLITTNRYNRLVEITKENGTYTEAITANAYDKSILNAAKADMLEKLVNGDSYRLDKENKDRPEGSKKLNRFNPSTNQIENTPTKRVNRW